MSGVPDTARDTLKPALTRTVRGRKNKVWAVAFFKDGRRVVTGSHDKIVRILDVRQGEMVGGPFKGHTDRVRSVAISPDDRRIASGGDDATVIIWDTESKQMILSPLVKHTEKVNSVCFSPDGKRVASGSHDSTVIVWNAETGAVLAIFDSQQHRSKTVHVWSVSFSPDGLKLASGLSDHTIRVWRTVNAECLLKINAGQCSVRSVVWSPDGNQLVSGSSDNTAKFWSSSSGEKIGQPCIGHIRWITCLAVSSDNSFIATASDDGAVRLWCTKTHKQIGHVLEHSNKVHSVAISPNAELLVSGSDDGNLQLWSVRDILEQGNVEGSATEDEEAQGEQLLSRNSKTQSSCDSDNGHTDNGDHDELSVDQDGTTDSSDNGDKDSLFDIFAIKTTVRNSQDLHIIEDLLTHEIDFDEDDNRRDTYANRSIIRARKSEWDDALQDAVKSIAIQPSLLGYISKAIALCGKKQLWDAMEAFDFAFAFSNSDPNIINLLLLIKAIALFNAGRHDEAVRRVQDLTTASQHSDPLTSSVVNSYLCVQLAIIAFRNRRYSEAADQLDRSIPSITDLFSSRALFEPRLKILTVLFGWDLDWSWQTVNQIRCEACLRADRVIEAVESHQHMMSMIDEDVKDGDLEWSITFRKDCTARCVAKGDEAVTAKNYETAIELYSAGIELDPSCEPLFVCRSKANLERNLFAAALHDANRVIKLNPSSHLGYQLRNAALRGAVRCDEAEEAFGTMFSKLDDTSDAQIQQLQHCTNIPDMDDGIRRAQLESATLRLLFPDLPPSSVFVDASTSFGIGFLADSRWLAWKLLDGWRADGRDIGWAEMVAIDLGLRALVCSGLRDVHVRFRSDNQGCVKALEAGRSRNVVQNDILQRLLSFALKHGIRMSVEWVRSCDNLADGISRGVFPASHSRFRAPPPLPDYLKPFVRLVVVW